MSKVIILLYCLIGNNYLPGFAQPKTGKQDSVGAFERRLRFIRVENCIAAYRDLCALTDSSRRITDASMEVFENLFESNAKVINDLTTEPPYPIAMRDYVSLAFNHLDTIGIDAYLTDYRYAAIPPEQYPCIVQGIEGKKVYLYDLPMTKVLMNGVDTEGHPVFFDFPKKVRIIITAHYYEAEQKVFIAKIILDSDEEKTVHPRKKSNPH